MTKSKEGSQLPVISRKPKTLAGLDMPETSKPTPKIRPDNNEKIPSIYKHLKNFNNKNSDHGKGYKDKCGDK